VERRRKWNLGRKNEREKEIKKIVPGRPSQKNLEESEHVGRWGREGGQRRTTDRLKKVTKREWNPLEWLKDNAKSTTIEVGSGGHHY